MKQDIHFKLGQLIGAADVLELSDSAELIKIAAFIKKVVTQIQEGLKE